MKLVLTWNVRLFKYLTSIWTFTDGSLWDGQVMAAKTQNRLMISIFYSGLQSKFMTVQTLAFLHIFDWSGTNCQNNQDNILACRVTWTIVRVIVSSSGVFKR